MVTGEIDQLTALSGNLPIDFQEVGCPAGGASTLRNSGSEQAQVEFITVVGHELATRPQLRAAFWFQLVDWSPELAATFGEVHVAEGLSELGARFEETLSTIGLQGLFEHTASEWLCSSMSQLILNDAEPRNILWSS